MAASVHCLGRGVVALWMLVLAGCAAGPITQINQLDRSTKDARILLMPLDVELAELTAGGLLEPKAEWTEQANRYIGPAMQDHLRANQVQLVAYNPGAALSDDERLLHQRLIKLHGAVGKTVLVHHYTPPFQLPTKKAKFDWSLGSSAQTLRNGGDADYALFVHVRDSYVSAGRAAVMVVGAILGVGLPGGAQIGFASLIDLKTGDIVWFNRLARATGDLRTPVAASETARSLLASFPK